MAPTPTRPASTCPTLLSRLRSESELRPDRCRIITIAVGDDADVDTLKKIGRDRWQDVHGSKPGDIRDALLDAIIRAG